jgi:hypothetical protein
MNVHPVALTVLTLCLSSLAAAAQPAEQYSLDRKVKFEPGNAQMTQGLKNVESIREIVTSGYQIAAEDLNDDQYPEIIVLATSRGLCGDNGCRLVVLRNTGPARFEVLAQLQTTSSLGVTREKSNGYRLLASLDAKGGIALAGQQPAVHAMLAGAAAATTPASGTPHNDARRELLNVKLGMPLEQAKAALRSLKPPLAPPPMPESKVRVPLLPDGGFVASYYAPQVSSTPGGTFKTATVQFSPPPEASRAVAISQTVQYGASEAPTLDNFLAAVKEKYGNPHQTRPLAAGFAKLYWAWTPDGAPLPAAQLQRCESIGQSLAAGNRTPLLRSQGFLNEASQLIAASRKANCGLFAYVDYQSANSFVTGMNIVVADIAAADAALEKSVAEVDRLLTEQQNKKLQDAKDRKPDL